MLRWCTIGGREQLVRPFCVPAGSNSPVDCWKERGRVPGECRSEQSVAGVAIVLLHGLTENVGLFFYCNNPECCAGAPSEDENSSSGRFASRPVPTVQWTVGKSAGESPGNAKVSRAWRGLPTAYPAVGALLLVCTLGGGGTYSGRCSRPCISEPTLCVGFCIVPGARLRGISAQAKSVQWTVG